MFRFVFSKLNPGIKYVQGMNELIGPIYYVFASDPDREWAEWAEADCFYVFQNLMSDVGSPHCLHAYRYITLVQLQIRDNFIKTMDNSHCGIEATLCHFHQLLRSIDAPLHDHLVRRLQVRPQFYAFRWIALLLSQEFSLPDVIALWDTLFSCFSTADSSQMLEMCQHFCLAMLLAVREELLQGDFSQCVRLLQNYPNDRISVDRLINATLELRAKRCLDGSGGKKKGSPKSPNKTQKPSDTATDASGKDCKPSTGGSLRIKSRLATLLNSTKERMTALSGGNGNSGTKRAEE